MTRRAAPTASWSARLERIRIHASKRWTKILQSVVDRWDAIEVCDEEDGNIICGVAKCRTSLRIGLIDIDYDHNQSCSAFSNELLVLNLPPSTVLITPVALQPWICVTLQDCAADKPTRAPARTVLQTEGISFAIDSRMIDTHNYS